MVHIRELPKDGFIDASGRMSRSWEIWFNDLRFDVLPKMSDAAAGNLAIVTLDGKIQDGGIAPTDFAGADHDHTAADEGGIIETASWSRAAAQTPAVSITTPTAPADYNQGTLQTRFTTLATEVNAIVTVLNGVIAKLKAAGVMNT